jgi:hypothetical protein
VSREEKGLPRQPLPHKFSAADIFFILRQGVFEVERKLPRKVFASASSRRIPFPPEPSVETRITKNGHKIAKHNLTSHLTYSLSTPQLTAAAFNMPLIPSSTLILTHSLTGLLAAYALLTSSALLLSNAFTPV